MERRRTSGKGAAVALLLGTMLIALPLTAPDASAQPDPADGDTATSVGDWSGTEEPLTIVSEERHPNGLVVTTFSNGATVAGEAGATVSLHETDDGTEVSTELSVETPAAPEPVEGVDEEPGFTTRDAALALGIDEESLAELGLDDCEWLSEEACGQDAEGGQATAGAESMLQPVPPTPSPSASGCAEISSSHTYAWGCWNRYKGETRANTFYNGYHSSVAAKSKGIWTLTGASTRHNFTDGRSVARSPNEDIDGIRDCRTQTFGVSGYGVQATTSSTVCPEKIHVTVEAGRYWIDWRGKVGRDTTRSPEGVQIVETPKGKVDGHRYSIVTSSH